MTDITKRVLAGNYLMTGNYIQEVPLMKNLVAKSILIILSLFPVSLSAQTAIDPLFATTTIVAGLKDEQEQLTASGFFYSDDQGKIYLVTNKHVIYGEKFAENPDPIINRIRLRLHTNPNNVSLNKEIIINLMDGKKRVWFEYKADPGVDVVLIPVTINRADYFFVTLDKSFIDSGNIQVLFEKIFIMGYPYGWYDQINNLPITRVGHLSSPFRIPFQGKSVMLGDVETHPGMSGGPVFMKLEDYTEKENNNWVKHLGSSKTILIGIFSGQPIWQLTDKKTGLTSPPIRHTLANIWFSDLIIEILKKTN